MPARRFRALLGVVALVFAALLALTAQSSEAFAASWATGVEASLPANAGSIPDVSLNSVSCAAAGNCSAVGEYHDSAGHYQGLLLTESAGTWAAGVEATLPAGARANPGVSLASVSCPSAGNCSAVGNYYDSAGQRQGLLLTESAGTWATAVEATLPAGVATNPDVSINSVSCPSAGNCSAVGNYYDSAGHYQGVLLSETAGTWAAGVEATLPAGAATDPSVTLSSVSCPSAGNCGAVGSYLDSSSRSQGVLLSETAGTWATGVEASLPANAGTTDPGVDLSSVSCASGGNCGAVGHYTDSSGNYQGVLLSETAGTWATGVEASLPANAGSNPYVTLNSVSCASAGNCSAVGYYDDSSGHQQGLLLSETAGTWSPGVEVTPPANAGSDPGVYVGSVSCASAGNCGTVGSYLDNSNHQQGLLLTETADTWSAGVEATLPVGARPSPGVSLVSVSCASAGNCSAVGNYQDSAAHYQGVLLSTLRRVTVSKRGSGRGSVTSSPAGINCGASCSHSFNSGRAVTLTARAARGSGFAGWSGPCSGRGACRVKLTTDRTVPARFALLPNTKITKAKINKAHHRARFKFKALGKSTGFKCALVKGKKHKKPKPHFASCRSPKTYKGLAPGGYSFLVRAFNAGGPDRTPAKQSFRF